MPQAFRRLAAAAGQTDILTSEADMDILDAIRNRRTIRKYKTVMPDDEDIQMILEAGRWAPSGLNNQPWRFKVIQDRDIIKRVSAFTKYGPVVRRAPMLVIVCMDTAVSYNRDKDIMAIGACIQNILLCAHSLGLGACWLGEILNKKEELAEFLDLNEDLEIMAVISLGYPDEVVKQPGRKPLSSLTVIS
jgi:nitroreductase